MFQLCRRHRHPETGNRHVVVVVEHDGDRMILMMMMRMMIMKKKMVLSIMKTPATPLLSDLGLHTRYQMVVVVR